MKKDWRPLLLDIAAPYNQFRTKILKLYTTTSSAITRCSQPFWLPGSPRCCHFGWPTISWNLLTTVNDLLWFWKKTCIWYHCDKASLKQGILIKICLGISNQGTFATTIPAVGWKHNLRLHLNSVLKLKVVWRFFRQLHTEDAVMHRGLVLSP